jgi:transposase
VDWVAEHLWFILEPVLRSDDQKGFVVLPKRWLVERTFGWLTRCRRLTMVNIHNSRRSGILEP